MCMLFTENT